MAGSIQALVPRMREICGAGHVITDPLELRTYECDGLTSHRCVPALAVLPATAAEVASVVGACAAAGMPFVARGSGTGLSGGALPRSDGALVVMSRMRSVLEIDPGSRRAVVQPGGLLGGRQRGGELRWRALSQARVHHAPRDRAGDRHAVRRADLAGRRD